ncbi:DGQHR domain-containing protein [Pedobacter gandavensis]|uniref:DGQHR domain-containing protein n=1 Tax=Pedobacter gandavensis TaxID=2679963 RepID=A0ABR6EQ42_9SPHI|nr:DGQHR domain-containing protein [Pedobacter gandavensis]MBB2147368.1 DGQHR domain-containing protein [Pedobacter gandavensis]
MEHFLKVKAILVTQPLGDFFICKVKAEDLLKITFSSEFRIKEEYEEKTTFIGNQRAIKLPKSKSIGTFIDSVESTFPNSIILAANYDSEGREIEDEALRWSFERESENIYAITIPTHQKIASIIDGQHRLDGFRYIENMDRLDMELVCSIYFDLPVSYQAYIFANINSNQSPVSKNLTYNLYGFNLDVEERTSWSPEKLSVYITRSLNFNRGTLFYKKIKITPKIDNEIVNISSSSWEVSTSTMVEGIVSLISIQPKRDQDILAKVDVKIRNRELLNKIKDNSPLRLFYLNNNDIVVEKTVENFFKSVNTVLFSIATENSFIYKNIGFKALFIVLLNELQNQVKDGEINIKEEYFDSLLQKLIHIDFSDPYFRVSSYVGKSRMANIMLMALSLKNIDEIKKSEDQDEYQRLLKRVIL